MLNSTWNIFKRPVSMKSGFCMLTGILMLGSCMVNRDRDRGYDPPRMGAEYRFEEGLDKEKKPQHLFDKKTRKEMAKMGYPTGESNAAPKETREEKPAMTAPQTATKKVTPVDSLRMDTVYKVRPQ
jgi:hypothetical protein